MLKSMTGYGRGEIREDGTRFLVELKTVNHKYSDVYIKLPRQLMFFEDKVVEAVKSRVSRGKADVFVTFENYGKDAKQVLPDKQLAEAYINACRMLSSEYGLEDDTSVSLISGFPDVLRVEKAPEDEQRIWKMLETALNTAIDSLIEMRTVEGEKLVADVLEKLDILTDYTEKISKRAPFVVTEYKDKLTARIKELQNQQAVDESRLATEVAFFADRCDINEEIVRLRSHIKQTRSCLNMNEPVGKKLDFLVQELNREINTIGSKANDLDITRNVLEVKTVIDQIREQVQNIE